MLPSFSVLARRKDHSCCIHSTPKLLIFFLISCEALLVVFFSWESLSCPVPVELELCLWQARLCTAGELAEAVLPKTPGGTSFSSAGMSVQILSGSQYYRFRDFSLKLHSFSCKKNNFKTRMWSSVPDILPLSSHSCLNLSCSK